MRVTAAVALTAVAAVVLPAMASAQQSDERRQCFAKEGVTPAQKVEACTVLITSGGQTTQELFAAYLARGGAHLTNRNYDRAIEDYGEVIRLSPSTAPLGLNFRGLSYLRKGEIDRAIEDFSEAIRLDSRFALNSTLAMYFVNRALAYREKAQWDFDAYLTDGVYEDRAIADYDEAIRLNSNNAAAFRSRGFLHTRRQQYDRAIQDFDEAIRLDPNVAAAFSGRAYALRFVGQYERAIADYRKALTLQLDDASRIQIEKTLKQLGAAPERDAAPTAVTKR